MDSNKYFPDFLGETKLGTYFVSAFFSLRVDDNSRTIWLNLETAKGYFQTDSLSTFNCPIMRISSGKKNDFILYVNNKFKSLFEIFNTAPISIQQKIKIFLNPQILGEKQEQLIEHIKNLTKDFSNEDKKDLIKFSKFVSNLQKESMPKLLSDSKYTLIFGSLEIKDEIENMVSTLSNPELKKHNLTQSDIRECFGNIVLSERVFQEVFIATGLVEILANPPQLPKSGGAIFIDMGGTGKSEMKKSLKLLWKKLGGECVEKNGVAEFGKENTFYATLIESWYFGSKDSKENNYDKEGLFNASLRTKVPSLLIIDEADRFVRVSHGNYHDTGAEMIINEFKRYLTGRDKGGVQGNVLTIFIANVDENELNPQLKMGGERLRAVYFGPPTKVDEWLRLIDMYFKNLRFTNRDANKDKLLAELLLKHNSLMSHEKFMISPRKFGSDFCGNYLLKHFKEEVDIDGESFFDRLHSFLTKKRDSEQAVINYQDFMLNLINDLLLAQVKLANLNIDDFKTTYYNFINLNSFKPNTQNTANSTELDEVQKIISDEDFKRIVSAKLVLEIFGYSSIIIPSRRELDRTRMGLLSKFHPDKYTSEKAKKILNLLLAKINTGWECLINEKENEFKAELFNFSEVLK